MFRVISWNIRHGGGTRTPKIIGVLQKAKPTVIILSEFHNNVQGQHIIKALHSLGYHCYCHPEVSPTTNTVMMASLLPCKVHLHAASDPVFAYNILSLEFEIFEIYGVYFPHKKKHALFQYILHKLGASKPAIIAGDFNAGINGIDQSGNSFWYEADMLALPKIGYIDCYRQLHGDTKTYSWYSHQGNGFRYDHTYMHVSLVPVLRQCYYLDDVRTNGFSDHAAMVLELGG